MVARRAGAVLLAIMLGAGLAACGDDGGSEDDAVDQVDRDGDGSDDGNTDDGSDDGSDDGNTDDGDVDLPTGLGEECAELGATFNEIVDPISGGASAEEVATFFEQVSDAAPEELRDDFEVYGQAMAELQEALDDAGVTLEELSELDPTDPESLGIFTQVGSTFSSPEVLEAATNIGSFFASNCQVQG
jgi:hypothetical protein